MSGDPLRSSALDPRRARALTLRMAGLSWEAIASKMGEEGATVSRETVRSWSLTDEWAQEYDARRAELDRATKQAQVGLVEMAYDTTRSVMLDPDASDDARLRAADIALRYLGPPQRAELAITGTREEIQAELARLRAARGEP